MVKINPIFQPLLTGNDRYYFLTGGRGSGKSFSVAFNVLMLSFEIGHVILYTRLTMVSAKKSIIPEFQQMIERMGLEDVFTVTNDQIINKHSGSVIWFMGLKASSGSNTARLKSLAGVTTWVIDEFEDMFDEEVLFDKIDNSIRTVGKKNRVIMVMNPSTKEFWAYDRFFNQTGIRESLSPTCTSKEGVTYIHTTYEACADHLDPTWLQKALNLKQRDPEKYTFTYLGGWRDKAEGVIITNWDYLGSTEDCPYDSYDNVPGREYRGLDFGFRDPMAYVAVKHNKKLGHIYLKLLAYETEATETEIIAMMVKHGSRGVKVVADGARPEHIEAIRRKGFNISAADKSPGSVLKGLHILQDHKIFIECNGMEHLITREFNNYAWEEKGKKDYPQQNTGMDHIIDALRYVVAWMTTKKYSNDLTIY